MVDHEAKGIWPVKVGKCLKATNQRYALFILNVQDENTHSEVRGL